MAPQSKNSSGTKDRRKSDKVAKPDDADRAARLLVTLTVPPAKLKDIIDPSPKESTPVKEDSSSKGSPDALAAVPPTALNKETGTDSSANTPANGTPAPPTNMGPPAEPPKKKGVKRAANENTDPLAIKVRNKPGPKKKQKLDDGTAEANKGAGGATRLGPKASLGAINAGLRALDRSGKPCRKWQKGGFRLKSFTGVLWEIPRWTAPPKPQPEENPDASTSATASASADGSNKENKDQANGADHGNTQAPSDSSKAAGDVEMTSAVPSVSASSPAPQPIAAAS